MTTEVQITKLASQSNVLVEYSSPSGPTANFTLGDGQTGNAIIHGSGTITCTLTDQGNAAVKP